MFFSYPKMACLTLALFLFWLIPAFADYHYVSPDGSDQYPYSSWNTAAHIIDSAIYAASAYDTIYIGAGNYYQTVRQRYQPNPFMFIDTCLTFIGAGVDSTKIWYDQLTELWIAVDRTLIQDMWLDLTTTRGMYGAILGSSIAAKHCKFTSNFSSYAIMAGGPSVYVENCEFYDVDVALDALYPDVLVFRNNYMNGRNVDIMLADWRWGIIENNILITPFGIDFNESSEYSDSTIFRNNYLEHLSWGFSAENPLKCQIENNTTRISDQALRVNYLQGDPGSINIRNNALTESGYGISAANRGAESLQICYNGFWGNWNGDMIIAHWDNVDTVGNINAFPMYANPDSHDVHLQAYSPFIDAGDPNILDVNGTRSDIGVFGGPGGSSYQYQDSPPQKPDSLAYRISGDSLIITWRKNYESDFRRYIINRDTVSGFTPWAGNIVGEPDTNLLIDLNWDNSHNYYYKIAAYDNQGNLSPYSDELAVYLTGVDDNSGVEVPYITAIESNYPNPFNSSTTIIYTVANLGPIPAQININIYDIQGRKVRSLLDNREGVGRHTITWDGKDDDSHDLSSGIYFARIMQWKVDYLSRSQKLLLVR